MSGPANFYFVLSRPEMVGYIPMGATRILDVGCGEGNFGTLVADQRHAEVWGAEIDEKAAEVAKGKLHRVIAGDVTKNYESLPEHYFDCICCNDVLEHMSDPHAALVGFHRLLSPQGVVVASIPNIRYYRALKHIIIDRDFRYSDWGVFDRTHLRFFTKKSIVRMFLEAGFDVKKIEGINPAQSERKFKRLAIRTFHFLGGKLLADTKYMQFACLATPKA